MGRADRFSNLHLVAACHCLSFCCIVTHVCCSISLALCLCEVVELVYCRFTQAPCADFGSPRRLQPHFQELFSQKQYRHTNSSNARAPTAQLRMSQPQHGYIKGEEASMMTTMMALEDHQLV